MDSLKRLHWPLIIGLGALALVWPVLNLTGLMDLLGRPVGPLLVIVLISLVWLGAMLLSKVREPLLTLTATGAIYGLFAILIGALLAPLVDGQASGPMSHPIAIVMLLLTNSIWGALVGLCAQLIQARK